MIPMILIAFSSLALLVYVLLNFFHHVEPAQLDIAFLRKKNLYLLHILRILESPDYKYLSERNRRYRDYLFVSYAGSLKQDMDELAALRLGANAYLYYVFFNIFYTLLLLKNRISSSASDLRVLAGIELMVVKNIAPAA